MAAASRVSRLLQIRPGELAPVAILVAWYFCVIGAAFVGRAVRDSLFLAHLSAAGLPAMYVVSPLVLTGVGVVYARVEGRLRRDRLVIGTLVVSGAFMVAARVLIGTGDWIYYTLYVAVNVISGLIIMQTWTVASDRFTSRDAKRLFGLIGAGGTAADIAIGAVLAVLAPRIGAEDLLYVCAGLLFAAAALAMLLGRVAGRVEARPRSRVAAAPHGKVPGASHLGLVGACLVCSVFVVTLVEFQFKAVTAVHFGADRAGMVAFFGNMSIATGVVSLIIQLVATRWVLQRLGVAGALLILPLGLAAGEVGLLIVPGLIAATVLKMSDETFRFTVNDAASQLLFLPVPSRARGRWKAIVDNAWKPGAQLALGLVLLAYRALAPGRIAPLVFGALGVIAIWCALVIRLRAAYVQSLRDTLRHRPAGLEVTWRPELGSAGAASPLPVGGDPIPGEELAALRGALVGGDRGQRLAALELLGPRAGDDAGAAAALASAIAPLCDDADPAIRRAACAALAGSALTAPLRAHLDDEDDGVRTAALGALLARGDPDREARARLAALAGSADPAVRVRAAEVLAMAGAGAHGDAEPGGLLPRLLADPDLAVARAAVIAAAAVGSSALLAPLLAGGGGDRVADRALATALAACGTGAEGRLGAALADPARSPVARREVARALGMLGSADAIARLLDYVVGPGAEAELRTHAVGAIARAARQTALGHADATRVRRLIDAELVVAYRALAAAEGLGRAETAMNPDGSRAAPPFLPDAPEGASALLSAALRERQDAARDRVLLLIEALYPGTGIDTIAANLREPDPARRANAIEVLDATLDRGLRARVIPLVDESPRYAKLAAVAALGAAFAQPRQAATAWVAELLADPAPWIVACAAYYAGVHGVIAAIDRLGELLAHADATVRETALVALSHLIDAARLRRFAAGLTRDAFPALAARAQELAAS